MAIRKRARYDMAETRTRQGRPADEETMGGKTTGKGPQENAGAGSGAQGGAPAIRWTATFETDSGLALID